MTKYGLEEYLLNNSEIIKDAVELDKYILPNVTLTIIQAKFHFSKMRISVAQNRTKVRLHLHLNRLWYIR